MAQHRRRAIGLLRGGGFALLSLVSATVITAEVSIVRAPQAPPPVAGVANISPVTDAMLLKPPPADWLMWRGTLNSWGYSPLKQINTGNVRSLQLVWTRALEPGLQEGTPLVHDGVLYFPNPGDTIDAINAVSGDLIWQHRHPSPPDIEQYINAPFINRNIAIHGNLLIGSSADGFIYAIDARTGKDAWATEVLNYKRGIHHTAGPIVADGKVFSGRGCEPLPDAGPSDCVITAHDAVTGKELWRRRTIPGPGEPGNETWGDVPYAERKHVGTWMPPSYDPELHLLIIGTSVTSPAPKFLLGGNDKQHLYHNSTLALNPDTGEIVWYYQHLIDHWDLDHPFARILLDEEVAPSKADVAWINPDIKPGTVYPVVTGIPGKTGIVYTLDRRNGKFLWARPTIYQNVVESIDGKTGAVHQTANTQFHATGDSALVCPNSNGGKNWPAGAYSPLTKAMYYPMQNTCAQVTVVIHSRKEHSAYGISSAIQLAPGTTNVGSIHAISAVTGKTDWKFEQRAATFSLVTTGGGLLFGGDVAGRFRAYDQRTGDVLWEVNLGSPVTGYPVSFAVNGRQYIAVSTGSSVSGSGHLALTPEIRVGNSNNLYVFALPEGVQTTGGPPRPLRRNVPAAAMPVPVAAAPICQPKDGAENLPVAQRLSPAGRFSAAQSAAGRTLYVAQQCATCHGATMGGAPGAPALNDVGFRGTWRGRSLNALLDCTRSTMPPGRGGTLSDAQYMELIAAILEANGFKPGAGGAGLPTEPRALSQIVMGDAR